MNNPLFRLYKYKWTVFVLFMLLPLLLTRPAIARPLVQDNNPLVQDMSEVWSPVLGDAGSQMVDTLIKNYTPECICPTTEVELIEQAAQLRAQVIADLSLDFERRPYSVQVQHTIDADDYRIDVIRLEIFAGLYLPLNVYIPDSSAEKLPLVILLPGCGWGASTDIMQIMAANLVKLRMVVVIPEGFCDNGARSLIEYNEYIDYAKAVLGLPGNFDVFLQEAISVVTWAIEAYPQIDASRIGAAGYSYGGQMALTLAAVDTRIHSISVPATYIGDPCENFALNSDIWIETVLPGHVWGVPHRLPIMPISWRIPLLYPRSFHTTSGYNDPGATPVFLDDVMAYAQKLYSLGNHEEQLLYRRDDLNHSYQQSRREDTYEWFMHTLWNEPLTSHHEVTVMQYSPEDLMVDLAGTTDNFGIVRSIIDPRMHSFLQIHWLAPESQIQIAAIVNNLFPDSLAVTLTQTLVWQQEINNISIEAFQVTHTEYAFPVFIFENKATDNSKSVLFLSTFGTYRDLATIGELLQSYQRVISLDYWGIGELKSNRVLLHTFARYFMYNKPSIPDLNIQLIRAYLHTFDISPIDIYASGWASSFYALILKWMEPNLVAAVLPAWFSSNNELSCLELGCPIPDLLLQDGLFAGITGRELAAALPVRTYITINSDAVDTTSLETFVMMKLSTVGITPRFTQLRNGDDQWHTFDFEEVQKGIIWQLTPSRQEETVFAQLVDELDQVSPVVTSSIRIADIGDQVGAISLNGGAEFTKNRYVTLMLNAPAFTAEMRIANTPFADFAESPEAEIPQWEPFTYQRKWFMGDEPNLGPNYHTYVQFRDVFGNESPIYFEQIMLDEIPPSGTVEITDLQENSQVITVTLAMRITDNASGIADFALSTDLSMRSLTWQSYTPTVVYSFFADFLPKKLYVWFRDYAGNISEPFAVTLEPSMIELDFYLPLIIQ